MKTLFIPIFHALQSRNIMMTDVIDVLRADDSLRIILLVPPEKVSYYRDKFSSNRLVVEDVPLVKENRVTQIATIIAKNLYDSRTVYWRQRQRLFSDHNRMLFWFSRAVSKISYLPYSRFITRRLFSLFADKQRFLPFFEKYKPDLVFLPDIYALDDVCLGLVAQACGVKCIGMVRSWDNVTGKGVCLIRPDKIAVNNEIIKSEVKKFLTFPDSDIEVVGVPQFDYYVGYEPSPRTNFFEKIGLKPEDDYLLFVPYFGSYREVFNEVIAFVDRSITEGRLPNNLKIVVRMPPSFSPGKTEVYSSPNVTIDYPGVKFGREDKTNWEFSKEDMIHFADSLYYAKVVISSASTITIDAAALDRPSINVMFDGDSDKEFAKSLRHIFTVEHFDAVLASGGTSVAKNHDELVDQINAYIKHPELDKEGRNRLVREQCWRLDGQSGKRLGDFILSQLK